MYPAWYFWLLFALAMLVSSIGFKNYVWFISLGYGFSIAAAGLLMLILFGKTLTAGTILCCVIFFLYGCRLGGYLAYRELKSSSYKKNMVGEIKDGNTVWSPGWKPCKTELDSYECRHGMGYTRIKGVKDDLEVSVLFFVPLGTPAEIQKVSITNNTGSIRHIKLFSFAEWCLWNASTDMENFQRNLSTGEVEVEEAVIFHKTEYR